MIIFIKSKYTGKPGVKKILFYLSNTFFDDYLTTFIVYINWQTTILFNWIRQIDNLLLENLVSEKYNKSHYINIKTTETNTFYLKYFCEEL